MTKRERDRPVASAVRDDEHRNVRPLASRKRDGRSAGQRISSDNRLVTVERTSRCEVEFKSRYDHRFRDVTPHIHQTMRTINFENFKKAERDE